MFPLQKAQFYAQCKAYLRLNEQLCRMLYEYEIQNSHIAYNNNYYYDSQSYSTNQLYLNLQARGIHNVLPYYMWDPYFKASLIARNAQIAAVTEQCELPANTWLFPQQRNVLNEENPQLLEESSIDTAVRSAVAGSSLATSVKSVVKESSLAMPVGSVVEKSFLDTSVKSTEALYVEGGPSESPTAELRNIDLQVLDINEQTLNELLENRDNLGDGGVFDKMLEEYFSDSSTTLYIDTDYESDREIGTTNSSE